MAATDTPSNSSISVTVRVRPFTIREAAQLTKCDDGPLFLGDGSLAGVPAPKLGQKGIRSVVKVVDDRCLVFDPPEENPVQRFSKSFLPAGKKTKDQTFAFDKVFDENITQSDVYEATTKNLLDSVLDGYNATVFAYGATGCGKTHTITGTVQQPGIIFLTMQELFERISDVQEEKVTEISLSYLEIYNETIRDLLATPGTVGSKGGLMLREDANQAVSVAGLSSHHPQNVQQVMDMIVQGNELRTMSPTEANATSSRSHAVLQINVSQKDRNADVNEPHTMATLSIIDLAGSERASATKNRGERLMEGANINKSLLALGSCINALCDPRKRNHVPYRNSKLTRLLKFSLGGNCRTVMIVCVSPSSAHFDETQNTLRYANRAKNIQTKVTRNVYNVNRHVKDFLKKIDEQMTLINELKQQQKDYEAVAFSKFKKQSEKRDAVVREGMSRLRAAYDHSQNERYERINSTKKLRQIERRIGMITSWTAAFDHVCKVRDEEEAPKNLLAMKKTAQGILAELEQSRHHYHQRLSKNNWQRALDSALQTGLKQLQEMESGVEQLETDTLTRETELLKSNAERELHMAVIDQEKNTEAALMQVLLQAHFETAAIINQILMMEESEAVSAAKSMLNKILTACSDATGHVIKPDGSLPIVEAQPPTKAGTPKRKRGAKLLGPSPMKPRLEAVPESAAAATPKLSSPFKLRVGSAKKTRVTPRKKSPVKRSIRWRDDTEGGTLQDYSQTPRQEEDSTPDAASSDIPHEPQISNVVASNEVDSSSPIEPPNTSLDVKPRTDRFQAGFLSRKSTAHSPLTTVSFEPKAVAAEPSPLQEMTNNRASGRIGSMNFDKRSDGPDKSDENATSHSSSDSETAWAGEKEDAQKIRKAMKRASMSRASSVRDSINRAHRRRSPLNSSNAGSPLSDNGMFSKSHARRMVKSDRDADSKAESILSPRATPIQKTSHLGPSRRVTMSVGDERNGLQRSASRGAGSRPSSIVAGGSIGSANRGSLSATTNSKSAWR